MVTLRLKGNAIHRGEGEHGKQSRKAGIKANAHMPMRHDDGLHDRSGYKDSPTRRNGAHTGKQAKYEQGLLGESAKGNGKGTAPPALSSKPGVRGTPESHMGDAGRGGTGRIGKHDAYKGAPTKYSEDISHSSFEKL